MHLPPLKNMMVGSSYEYAFLEHGQGSWLELMERQMELNAGQFLTNTTVNQAVKKKRGKKNYDSVILRRRMTEYKARDSIE